MEEVELAETQEVELSEQEKIENELKKEKELFIEKFKNPKSVSDMINSQVDYKRFKELFTEGKDVKIARCRRKSCTNNFIKMKGVEFCSLDCYNTYYKRGTKNE
jgi:hypothetical protein